MKLVEQGIYKLKKDKNLNMLYEVWFGDVDSEGEQDIFVDIWSIDNKNKFTYKIEETHSIFYFIDDEFEKINIKYKVNDTILQLHILGKNNECKYDMG